MLFDLVLHNPGKHGSILPFLQVREVGGGDVKYLAPGRAGICS